MNPQEILLAAADGIESHDWCQGCNFVTPEGARRTLSYLNEAEAEPVAACAIGAICLVGQADIESRNEAIWMLERHLAGGNDDVRPSIAKWNDDKRRTKGEVVETLRRAARNS